MAKFTFFNALSGHGILPVFYDQASMDVVLTTSTKFVYEDAQGDRIVFKGQNFAPSAEGGNDPAVTRIEYFNQDGARLLTVSGLHIDPADLTFINAFEDLQLVQSGKDKFIGSGKSDYMLYSDNPGNDTLLGKGGRDTLLASEGNNRYDGGKGVDALSFQNTFPEAKSSVFAPPPGVIVDLSHGTVQNPWGGTDTVKRIEAVWATQGNDVITGSKAKTEYFTGYQGDDTFTGGKGKDIYDYTNGHDNDTFTDFGKGDKILIYGYSGEIADFDALKERMEQVGDDVVVALSDTDSFTFLDTRIGHLKAGMFEIVEF